MKCTVFAAALAASLATAAGAQPGPMGPGAGPGHGMGPGMGMMGGCAPGYGMGPGMMGEFGPGSGMGPGMMGGRGLGAYAMLDLSDEQRGKLAGIRRELGRRHWELMGKVHEAQGRLAEQLEAGKADEQAERNAYQAMADAHKQLFEASLDARKRSDAVLTPEQREQLRRGRGAGR